ncbi:hypothetical protein KQX54_021380 [Cotesia glomerata]|uniref:Uncharacterized protein n=1 Tax=Cotesia glomerata TaxID=32391 RepID=A0AAV7J6L0_COTGL|nr:hypothetical protein KQX54_021380 [Cotesia glomerata]
MRKDKHAVRSKEWNRNSLVKQYSTAHKATEAHPSVVPSRALLAKCDGVLRARLHSNGYYPSSPDKREGDATLFALHSDDDSGGVLYPLFTNLVCNNARAMLSRYDSSKITLQLKKLQPDEIMEKVQR